MNWYAVYTKSRHEGRVNDRLQRKEFETFFPLIEQWSRRKDRRKKILVPLFPGYVFVRSLMDPEHHVEILKTDSVVRVLGNNGHPIPIPDPQIWAIESMMKAGVVVERHPYLTEGMRVRVVNGPLMGVEGILVETRPSKNRLVVSVDLLKQSASLEIERDDVEPIAP